MWPPLHYNIRSIAENGGTEIAARGDAVAQMPIGSESSLEVKAPYNFVHLVNLTTHSAWCMYFNRENISHSLSVFLCITRVSASKYTKFIFKLCVSN